MATVRTISTSRLITSTVNHTGSWFGRPSGIVSTTNVETSSSLSAIGSSNAPRSVRWPDRRAISPSSTSVTPATMNVMRAQPLKPYRTRITRHGTSRSLNSVNWFAVVSAVIVGYPNSPARRASRSIASTASVPLTARVGANRSPASVDRTPAATARAALP